MNENPKILLDTNLWIYLYASNAGTKVAKIKQLIDEHFQVIIVSTQILEELYYVLTRKGFQSKEIIIKTVATYQSSLGRDFPLSSSLFTCSLLQKSYIASSFVLSSKHCGTDTLGFYALARYLYIYQAFRSDSIILPTPFF